MNLSKRQFALHDYSKGECKRKRLCEHESDAEDFVEETMDTRMKTSESSATESATDTGSNEDFTSDKIDYIVLFDPNEGEFSQWHPTECTLDGIKFNCAEQLMMYAKAKLFNDNQVANKILESTDPKIQKELGRRVRNFDPSVWSDHCDDIVKLANYIKFSQNSYLRERLLSTRGKTLALATPLDKFWGIGLSEKDSNSYSKSKWKGLNKLGNILMEVRDKLIEEENDKEEIQGIKNIKTTYSYVL